jgi:hypothetical protein
LRQLVSKQLIYEESAKQPPGIGIFPIDDMDVDQKIVTAAPAAKSKAETPRKPAEKLARSPGERR